MISALLPALSGLVAQQKRLEASAGNTANAHSTGSRRADGTAEPYQPVRTVQVSVAGPGGVGGGTAATYAPVRPAAVPVYDPGSPQADAEGVVSRPNVDPVAETVEQLTARNGFRANLQTVRTATEMMDRLLDLNT